MKKRVDKANWLNLALAIISVVIIASMFVLFYAMSSGAWYTSKKSSGNSITLNFANLNVENFQVGGHTGAYSGGTTTQSATISSLAPSMAIGYIGTGSGGNIKYTGNVKAYYKIFYTISNFSKTANSYNTSTTANTVYNAFRFNNPTHSANSNKVMYGQIDIASPLINQGVIIFDGSNGNEFTDISFTISITIQVVQADNIPNTYVWGSMSYSNYESLFTNIYGH